MSRRTPILFVAALLAQAAAAQEAPAPMPERVYVPIDKLDEVFAKTGRGVFVPYDELQELIKKARAAGGQPVAPSVEAPPPAEALLVAASYRAAAGAAVAQVEATFTVQVLTKDRWVVVPIGLGEAALEDVQAAGHEVVVAPLAELHSRSAVAQRRLVPTAAGYGLLLHGAGRAEVTCRFAVPIAAKPGESSFLLSLPGAPLTRFDVTIPEPGVRVTVGGALASEALPGAAADATQVRAYFGEATRANVVWNPKPKATAETARDPLLFASTETAVQVDEGVVHATARIDYQILQAPCDTFRFQIPTGTTLIDVRGEHVASVSPPREEAGAQTVEVRLHEPIEREYSLEVELLLDREEGQAALSVPRVTTLGTEQETGVVAVRPSEFLSLEPRLLRGAAQVDATALSARLAKAIEFDPKHRGDVAPLAFRYLRQPFALDLAVAPVVAEVTGQVRTLATVRDDAIDVRAAVRYRIRRRGVFGVKLRIPAGMTVAEIRPRPKDYRQEKSEAGWEILHVDFAEQVPPGSYDLLVEGRVNRKAAQPLEGEAELTLPRVGLVDVADETGLLGVAAESHLELSQGPADRKGLIEVPAAALARQGFPHQAEPGTLLTHGLRYRKPDGVLAKFTVRRREPKVTARVAALVDVQEDKVEVNAKLHYTVEHAGIDRLRFAVPEALNDAKALRIRGEGIKDKRCEQLDVKGVQRWVWTVTLQDKRLGDVALDLQYDVQLDGFQAGQQRAVDLHEVEVLDCGENEVGDFALRKHENLVVGALEATGLERRDARELPDDLRADEPFLGFHYTTHPYRLTLQLTKYDFQAPLGLLIEHLHHDEVLGADGLLKVEAYLELRNNAEQYLTVLLPAGARMRGLRVDGESQEWSEGRADEQGRPSIQVHLGEATQRHEGEAFLVRLRYDVPGQPLGANPAVSFPALGFPLADAKTVPVARLTRTVYAPEDYTYLEWQTDAAKHFDETSLWEVVKQTFGVRTGKERRRSWETANAAQQAIQRIRNLDGVGPAASGLYPALALPLGRPSFVLEKLSNPMVATVSAMRWSAFFIVDVLVLLLVVGLGVFVVLRPGALTPAAYVGGVIGLALLGGAFLGRGFEPYAGSALFGALGLGAFLLGRGMWRELTVLRHQRHLQALAEEVEVAKARAQAATEAARARGEAAPAEGGKKGGGADAAAEADALSYVGDEPTGEGASADADGDDAGQDA